MRKIRLCDTDGALFDEEMIPQDYEYLSKHKETFCRMWKEQVHVYTRQYSFVKLVIALSSYPLSFSASLSVSLPVFVSLLFLSLFFLFLPVPALYL